MARDGGDIKFQSFENGVVKVQLQGAAQVVPALYDFKTRGSKSLVYVKEVIGEVVV